MTSFLKLCFFLFLLLLFAFPVNQGWAQGTTNNSAKKYDHWVQQLNGRLIVNAPAQAVDTIIYDTGGEGELNQQYLSIKEDIYKARFDSLIGKRLKLSNAFSEESSTYLDLADQSEGWNGTFIPGIVGIDVDTNVEEEQAKWLANRPNLRDYMLNLLLYGLNSHGEDFFFINEDGLIGFSSFEETGISPAPKTSTKELGQGPKAQNPRPDNQQTSNRGGGFLWSDSITWILLGLLALAILTPILLHFLRQKNTQTTVDKKHYFRATNQLATDLYQYLSGPLHQNDKTKLEAKLSEHVESHKLGLLTDLRGKYLAKLNNEEETKTPIFDKPSPSPETISPVNVDLVGLDIVNYLKEAQAAPSGLSDTLKQQLDGLKAEWKLGHVGQVEPPPVKVEMELTEAQKEAIDIGQQVIDFQKEMRTANEHVEGVVYAIQTLKFMDKVDPKDYDQLVQQVVSNQLLSDALKHLINGEIEPEALEDYLKNRSIQLYGKSLQNSYIHPLQQIVAKAHLAEDNQAYLQQLLERYQPFFNQIEAMELPLQEVQKAWFFTHLFELAFHFYYYAQVSKVGTKNVLPFAYWNYEMVKQNRIVTDLQADKVKRYDKHIAHQLVHVIRALAQNVGIPQLDRVLIDGYHFDEEGLKK